MSNGDDRAGPSLDERVARIERRLDRIEAAAIARPEDTGSATADVPQARSEERDQGMFWALDGLRARVQDPGAVLFTGIVRLPVASITNGSRDAW